MQSRWCRPCPRHWHDANIGPPAAALARGQERSSRWLTRLGGHLTTSSSVSTYRLVSSSSDHSIRASKIFPTPSFLMSRARVDVAALDPRAHATEMTSHYHQRTTVTKIKTCGLSELQVDSSPEPLQPQPIVPLRVRLTRLSDLGQFCMTHTCSTLQASSPSEDGPLVTYSTLPPTPILSFYHLLHRTQSGTDYHENNLVSTHLHFLFGIT